MMPNVQAANSDRAIKLFQLSQHPDFPAVEELMTDLLRAFFAPPPQKPDEVPAWETATYTTFAIQQVLVHLKSEIEQGARLSSKELGEPDDAQNDRDNRRRA